MTGQEGIPTAPAEAEQPAEDATLQKYLGEVSLLLRAWYASRDSDSVIHQNLRNRDYQQACDELRIALSEATRVGYEIRLTVPEDGEPAETHTMHKQPYDFVSVSSSTPLEPGEGIAIKSSTATVNHETRTRMSYFGEFGRYLTVPEIAAVIGNGGILEASPVPVQNEETAEPTTAA